MEEYITQTNTDYSGKTDEFIERAMNVLISDCGYSGSEKSPEVAVRQSFNSIENVTWINIDRKEPALLEQEFRSFAEAHKYANYARSVYQRYVFVSSDYPRYANYMSGMLERLEYIFEESGLVADFAVFDIENGTEIRDRNGKAIRSRDLQSAASKAKSGYVTSEKNVPEYGDKKYSSGFGTPGIVLILINIAIFAFDYYIYFKTGVYKIREWGIQDNVLIANGEYYRLVSSMFLHADPAHIFGNMYFLFYLDRMLRRVCSDWEFLTVYFVSGVCGNLLSLLMTDYRSLGASGAIMGIGGLFIYKMFFDKKAKRKRNIGSYISVAILILFNLLYGVIKTEANIDNYGHFGGFIAGFVLALIIDLIRKNIVKRKAQKNET